MFFFVVEVVGVEFVVVVIKIGKEWFEKGGMGGGVVIGVGVGVGVGGDVGGEG